MDRRPARLLVHTACGAASKEPVPEAKDAYRVLLRRGMLHLFEVDARMLQSHLEMLCLRVRVLSEGLRA